MRRIVQWIGLALLVAGTASAQGWTAEPEMRHFFESFALVRS